MIGSLSKEQIEHVLHSAVVGRIGCYDGKDIYIIPLTFVFDGKYIYAHSHEGLKIEIMRKQPTVCFEVESIEGMTNWRCVMVHGTFQELKTTEEQHQALTTLNERLMPYLLSETMRPRNLDEAPENAVKEKKPVIYRIQINRMTGRYEKNSNLRNL